jgi:uncharacterized protein (TIGR02099 family)
MPSPLRRTLRITRRTAGYGFLVLLILAALAVSVANLLLPFIENNPQRVQAWLSERVGQPVRFQHSTTEWTRRGPRIGLTGLRVGEGSGAVEIARAELLVAVYSGLLPGHPLTELKAKDLHLRLEQLPDDSWQLLGVPRQQNSKTDALDVLSGFGELQLERSDLVIRPNRHPAIRIPRIDMRMRVQNRQLRIGLRAEARRGDAPLQLVADLDRRDMSGRVWIGGEKLDAGQWLALFPGLKVPAVDSESDLDVWAQIERRRIMRVHGRLQVADLALAQTKPNPARLRFRKDTLFDDIRGQWFWQRTAQGWQASVPEIRFDKGGGSERISDVRVTADAGRWAAQAQTVALNPFTVIMPLAKGQLPDVDAWLNRAGIQGQISAVKADGRNDFSRWRGAGYGDAIGFKPIGKAPGFQGISGVLNADERGGVLRFADKPVVLDWPVSFGRKVPGRFEGSLAWWQSGPDWVLGARDLGWQGDGMALKLDTEMHFMAGRKAPLLNLAAHLETFDFATAKRFWLRHLMPEASIRWLDMALVKGTVRDGSVLISGDLAEWPFANKAGRFSATATVLAEQLKFAVDWPAADNAVLAVDFNGPGFSAIGTADFLGSRVQVKPSGIARFHDSELVIDVHSDSDFARLMPVLQQTPLKAKVGSAVTALVGKGPVSADVRMLFPLKKGLAFNRIDGDIDLRGVAVRSPDWNLAMAEARGRARFDNEGFSAAGIRGRMDKNPVSLDLRVGRNHVKDAGNRVEAAIAGPFHADTLLRYDPSLADLKGVLNGQSQWQFGISMPEVRSSVEAPVLLDAQSNMVGTEIRLPVPLNKPAATAQAFQLRTNLPADKGVIEFRLGPAFRLLLKKPKDKPMAGIALFGAQTQGSIPVSGFSVRGSSDEFDAPAWLALAKKAEDGTGLQSFDLSVNHLRLMGEDFGLTRLQLAPAPEAMGVRASGARLDGQLTLSKAANAPITAKFSRVHFAQAGVPAQKLPSAMQPLDVGNPASLPAINLVIDDLRFGAVPLGRCELQTVPSKQGLLIQKFSTQSSMLSTSASGLWQGEGVQARTTLQANVNSPDLGKLLTAAQYGGAIRRGKTTAKLSGAWNGAPMDFSLTGFNGLLDLRIDEGQFPEVKAGGGRLLGLMSLAELPRRLSLNFNDLTDKGLGFNSIKGEFRFANGNATTQNLRIDAPAADIRISGSTDLVNERFDQRVLVQPKAGGILPIIGAATAGPLGAAAGVVAQAVLDKPLKEGSATEYRITGPWKEPEVSKQSGGERK